jgi:hypothetical protein
MTYLERYENGDHQAVWRELVALGVNAHEPANLSDAQAVAHTTMRRARQNVQRLIERLRDVGFRFDSDGPPMRSLRPDAIDALNRLEADVAALPLSIRAFLTDGLLPI